MSVQYHTTWVGKEVEYISDTGRSYNAVVTRIPERPAHAYTPLPTASLEFRDIRGKLIRKGRVLPFEHKCFVVKVWKPKDIKRVHNISEAMHWFMDHPEGPVICVDRLEDEEKFCIHFDAAKGFYQVE